MRKIYSFALNIALSIALFWLGFVDFVREKTARLSVDVWFNPMAVLKLIIAKIKPASHKD